MPGDSAQPPALIELGGTTPIKLYLRELWERREFAITMPANDIRAQNMDTMLGQLWHILNPALLVVVYYLIFGVVLDANRGVDNYLGFLVSGLLIFQLTQRVVLDATVSISRNEGLIRSIQFPRALLPISALVGQSIAFGPALLVLVATLLATGEVPNLRWLAILGVLVIQASLNLGGALIVARIGNAIPDLSQILPHLFRLLFYMSGVLFSVEVFVSNETLARLFVLNPVYDVVSLARWSLLGLDTDGWVLAGACLWSVLLPIGGLLFFRAAEHRYGA